MKLTLEGIKDTAFLDNGYVLPQFDIAQMRENTKVRPQWMHFGAGNILRAFPAALLQELLNTKQTDTGMVVVECYDEEIIDKAFAPYDHLALYVALKGNGDIQKQVIASIADALKYSKDYAQLESIMENPTLQMLSFTITEKGYQVTDGQNNPLPFCAQDFVSMEAPVSIIAKLLKLLYHRFKKGAFPLALVSMDNVSHNGTVLQNALLHIAHAWQKKGLVTQDFVDYLMSDKISFVWSMIDKITPRPDAQVMDMLKKEGFHDAEVFVTQKNTYVSAVVNAEEKQYLAIEDVFPNGRMCLEKTGVIFSNREKIDEIEKMKVCTCLNPLHTALAIFGCLLNHTKISEEMKDDTLKRMVYQLAYDEGMPVCKDPVVIKKEDFLTDVLCDRLVNPFLPDTPQRIACDTSKKLSVRFGETVKAYVKEGTTDCSFLNIIPLVYAGYARYLTKVNDEGEVFTLSPDPNLDVLCNFMEGFVLGTQFDQEQLQALLLKEDLFGISLKDTCLLDKTMALFNAMATGKHAIRETIQKQLK